ncbi:RING finger protein 212B isoform X5 [Arvicola amphibius]|uniref:RING finger protein 212B isoform X5 n=1 Tax=Arvicola amphibius TaxID=1047088 RepID=UPI0018E3C579|nr:RING finger protein 212B isoform X5 [Arvicola amphibius]
MDWFHCNQCFRKDGAHFFVTSCGHIFCKKCLTLEKCAVCGSRCKHLALSDNLKPQEKKFFKSPVETALQCFSHISQVWRFQKRQTDLLINFYKDRITKLEAAVKEAQQTVISQNKELSILRKENGELKKFLAILKGSPSSYYGSRLTTPRPVGITSPSQSVAPRPSSQHSSQVVSRSSSMESIPYTMAGFGNVEQGHRGLQERIISRDSYTGQRESRATPENLPGFQIPALQVLERWGEQVELQPTVPTEASINPTSLMLGTMCVLTDAYCLLVF